MCFDNDADAVAQDHIVCEICLSGTVYEGNEILFCDKCNVAVHQGCYSVSEIPPGSW
jgi:ribosomal protein L37AE/L43A